ncbi:MAG: hypothetical protein ACOZCO_03230 [Bacteroidota bacterium]
MNISFNKSKLESALLGINDDFRDKIIEVYIELKKRYAKSFYSDEYDAVGISSGKFCEYVYRFLEFEIFKKYTPFDKHISNFPSELNKLTQAPSASANESLRVIIPRALLLIYTLRNKRGIGHIGGDVQANEIDIATIVKNTDWVICELIRIYHNLSLEEAQLIVNSLNIKMLPDIWNIDGKKRILKNGLSFSEKTLLLLYNELDNSANIKDLFNWVEYSSLSMYKSKIILTLHKEKLIEFDQTTLNVTISPKGIQNIETLLTKT